MSTELPTPNYFYGVIQSTGWALLVQGLKIRLSPVWLPAAV